MARKMNAADRHMAELVAVPGCRSFAARRADLLNEAKRAHGDFYAFCLRDVALADADATTLTAAQIAALFDGASPAEVRAMAA